MSRVDPGSFTENQTRIITTLRRFGPQTKSVLASQCNIAWATVVKVINQLLESGIVQHVGTMTGPARDLRTTASLYSLRRDWPLAIGIDVEYHRTTRLILTNLAGEILAERFRPTPRQEDDTEVGLFFQEAIRQFLEQVHLEQSDVCGIGIGTPGIGFPSPDRRVNVQKARELELWLSRSFETRVRIGANTHAYAAFEKWSNTTFASSNFIFVSIRTGVGTGIFRQGQLYTGMHGLAGEIGHMKAMPNGAPCRCGGAGCLETLVNQHLLLQQYRTQVLNDPTWCLDNDPECFYAGLADLFDRAAGGEPAARQIVTSAARYLGQCLAHTITVLDITNIIISGHFGPNGSAIVQPLERTIREHAMPGTEIDLRYAPFDPDGYALGAALLVLKDFFADIPQPSLLSSARATRGCEGNNNNNEGSA